MRSLLLYLFKSLFSSSCEVAIRVVGLLKIFRSSRDLVSDTKRKEVPYLNFLMTCTFIADGIGREVNQEGVDYYNNLINELLSKGSHVH